MSPARPSPLFSVVIPTYNRAGKAVRAIESVLAQTLTDYDIWVIDDGSTDATAERLAPYLDRIHYIRQANSGVARARNRGIQESSGSYIALLDSDDCWSPHKLESFFTAIQAHPQAGLFYSQYEVVDETGRRLWVDRSRAVAGRAYSTLLKGDFLAASSAVIQRACLETVGTFDPAMVPCEDWDLWLRISRSATLLLVPEVLVFFEHTQQAKETSNTHAWLAAHDRVIEKAFAADSTLGEADRRTVQANLAYVKGRVCLQANAEREALGYFRQAASIQPTLWKAQIYFWVLSSPHFRQLLPAVLRRRMRLPDEIGDVI
jgi:GT2 family glycosyltransferase